LKNQFGEYRYGINRTLFPTNIKLKSLPIFFLQNKKYVKKWAISHSADEACFLVGIKFQIPFAYRNRLLICLPFQFSAHPR